MNRLQANLCLICVTLCWSTEVIIFSCIPDSVLPFATTFICNAIATVILAACFFKRIKREMSKSSKKILLKCLLLGVLNCAYNALYMYGLKSFDVSTGAFTFSMTVVVLPVVLLTMRKSVGVKTWISVALVLSGIVIALGGSLTQIPYAGLLFMLLGCIIRSVFIVKLNDFAREHDSITLSVFISAFVAVISFVIWFVLQPSTFATIPWSSTIIASLFIHAYFIVAFAQTLNIFAQRRATATESTIIYSLEIVFSLIWGAVLPENLVDRAIPTPFHIIGAVLIVAGSLVEIIEFKGKRRLKNVSEKQ
ncbi:MAG: DMT family transporter [Ruminococcus sp.]|nr:DMT family transporter [Ruminococcus sp.]